MSQLHVQPTQVSPRTQAYFVKINATKSALQQLVPSAFHGYQIGFFLPRYDEGALGNDEVNSAAVLPSGVKLVSFLLQRLKTSCL
jgi:hypothetical protein